jgi:hypothetical protein
MPDIYLYAGEANPNDIRLRGGTTYDGILKRWTGAAWVKAKLKRWDGGAWVAAKLMRWTGAAWVEVDATGV